MQQLALLISMPTIRRILEYRLINETSKLQYLKKKITIQKIFL